MTRYIAVLSLTLVIGIAVLSSSAIAEPQAATAAKRCGHFGMGFGGAGNIVARNMGCSFARDVAGTFMSGIPATGPKGKIPKRLTVRTVSYTHLTLPTTPYV